MHSWKQHYRLRELEECSVGCLTTWCTSSKQRLTRCQCKENSYPLLATEDGSPPWDHSLELGEAEAEEVEVGTAGEVEGEDVAAVEGGLGPI